MYKKSVMHSTCKVVVLRIKPVAFFLRSRHRSLESLSFTYTPNVRIKLRSHLKIENEQIKTAQKILMDKKLHETTKFLCAEIMNSRRLAKEKLGHGVQIRVRRQNTDN